MPKVRTQDFEQSLSGGPSLERIGLNGHETQIRRQRTAVILSRLVGVR